MALHREAKIVWAHSGPIVDDTDFAAAAIADGDVDLAGTGGDSATLSTSQFNAVPSSVPGQQMQIEAIDSPGDIESASHLGFPNARLERFRFNLDFAAFLVFWSRHASRSYGVLRRLDWEVRGEWRINPTTGNVTPVLTPDVQITRRSSSILQTAAATDVEVRGPSTIDSWARDGRV